MVLTTTMMIIVSYYLDFKEYFNVDYGVYDYVLFFSWEFMILKVIMGRKDPGF